MVDVVVSKFMEDISWTGMLRNSRLFVYDKSGSGEHIPLPNVGREAHTFLTHIVRYYEDLSDYVCFLQGNPFDGDKGHVTRDPGFIEGFGLDVDYFPLTQLTKCDLDGGPMHRGLDIKSLVFDRFFDSCPSELVFTVGAQFIVSKRAILRRSKMFYELLLAEFDREDIDNSLTEGGGKAKGNKMPWVMERVWVFVFSPKFSSPYDSGN